MNEGQYDERLNPGVQESTCLTYTGLHDKQTKTKVEEPTAKESI
jgi:hypothetical protein